MTISIDALQLAATVAGLLVGLALRPSLKRRAKEAKPAAAGPMFDADLDL